MTRFKLSLLALLVATLHLASPTLTRACSCRWLGVAHAYHYSDAIFIGVVKKFEKSPDNFGRRALLEVEMPWRGVFTKQVPVFTYMGGGDCGYEFEVGEKYLVFAHYMTRRSRNTELFTELCSGTASVKYTGPNSASVAALHVSNFDRGALIHGELVGGTNLTWGDSVPGQTIVAISDRLKREVTTDAKGKYQFVDLPPGEYRVFAKFGENETTDAEIIRLFDRHHYAERELRLRPMSFPLPK